MAAMLQVSQAVNARAAAHSKQVLEKGLEITQQLGNKESVPGLPA
jgi:hypothetical protein